MLFVESLILVGYFVPAVTILVAVGALTSGSNLVSLNLSIIGASLGAIIGSAVNFWIGSQFSSRLPYIWPFKHKPERLERHKLFIERHGGKAILLSRFTKALRPASPAVAGMLHMQKGRFMAFNLLGSLIWTPALLCIGYFGARSIDFGAQSPIYFSALLLIITGVIWLGLWVNRRMRMVRLKNNKHCRT